MDDLFARAKTEDAGAFRTLKRRGMWRMHLPGMAHQHRQFNSSPQVDMPAINAQRTWIMRLCIHIHIQVATETHIDISTSISTYKWKWRSNSTYPHACCNKCPTNMDQGTTLLGQNAFYCAHRFPLMDPVPSYSILMVYIAR